MNDEKHKENHFSQLKGYKKAVPIIFAALAVFTAACVFSKGSGFLGNGIGSLLRGLFSIGAYFIPFLLGIHAICYATDIVKRRLVSRSFFSVCLLLSASMIEYAVCHWGTDAIFAPARFYSDATAGGFIGGVLGFARSTGAAITVTVDNCINTGDFTALRFIAGVVGTTTVPTTITNCTNSGKITAGLRTPDYVKANGGIVGQMAAGTVTNCLNEGVILVENGCRSAGICGNATGVAAFSGCVNNGAVTVNNNGAGIL